MSNMNFYVRKQSPISYVRITKRPGQDKKHLEYSVQFPSPGLMMIRDYGCVPVSPDQELIFDGEDSCNNYMLSKIFLTMPQTTFCSSMMPSTLVNNDIGLIISYTSEPVKYWSVETPYGTQEFLNFLDAVEYFAKLNVYDKYLSRTSIINNSAISSCLCVGYDKAHTYVLEPMSAQELKEIKQYHQPLWRTLVENSSEFSKNDVAKNTDFLNQLVDSFYASCFQERPTTSAGKYYANFYPYTPPRFWFLIGRESQMPAAYKQFVMSDGHICLPLPQYCDTWTDKQRQAALSDFITANRSELAFIECTERRKKI